MVSLLQLELGDVIEHLEFGRGEVIFQSADNPLLYKGQFQEQTKFFRFPKNPNVVTVNGLSTEKWLKGRRTGYLSYLENKEFFDSHDFASGMIENPKEAWWWIGWVVANGDLEYHPPIRGTEKDRGATLHVVFPDPQFSKLDLLIHEFFDCYRTGWIMVNSISAFSFLREFDGRIPAEFMAYFRCGSKGDKWQEAQYPKEDITDNGLLYYQMKISNWVSKRPKETGESTQSIIAEQF